MLRKQKAMAEQNQNKAQPVVSPRTLKKSETMKDQNRAKVSSSTSPQKFRKSKTMGDRKQNDGKKSLPEQFNGNESHHQEYDHPGKIVRIGNLRKTLKIL